MASFKINFKDANCQYVEEYSAGKYGTKVKIYFCEGDGVTPKAYSGSVGAKTITADTIEELKKKLDREVASRDKEIAKSLTDSKKKVKDTDAKEVLKKLAGKTVTEHDLDDLGKELGCDGYRLWNILRDLAEDGKITKGEKYGEEYFKIPKNVKDNMCVLTQEKMKDDYDDLEDEWDYEINCEGNQWADGGFETYEEAEDEALSKVNELLEDFPEDYAVDDFEIIIRNTATDEEYIYDPYRVGDGKGCANCKDTDYVKTPRGEFKVVEKTEKELREDGYGYHHSSDDGKYKIFTKNNKAVAIKVKDGKNCVNCNDASAEDIIALFEEAYRRGKKWKWLEERLPSTFLNLRNKHNMDVFPIKQERGSNRYNAVNLTKPKTLKQKVLEEGNLSKAIEAFKDYLALVNELDAKYNLGVVSDINYYKIKSLIKEAKEKTDSRKEFTDLDIANDSITKYYNNWMHTVRDIDGLPAYSDEIDNWNLKYENGGEKRLYDYLLNKIDKSYEARNYLENQRKPIIYNAENDPIYYQRDIVGPLSEEAKNYIRRVMGSSTTEDIDAKRNLRYNNKPMYWRSGYYKGDILSDYSDEISDLKSLIYNLKEEQRKEEKMDISVSNRRNGYYKYTGTGNYDYNGRWKRNGGYDYTSETEPSSVSINIDGLESLEEALAKILNSATVEEVQENLEDALDLVNTLPRNNPKVIEIKNRIKALLEKRRNAPKRRRNLPDKKFVKSRKVE